MNTIMYRYIIVLFLDMLLILIYFSIYGAGGTRRPAFP